MSAFHPDSLSFRLEGDEQPLGGKYDEQADVLYLWRGDTSREAVSIASDAGHLIRIDPKTGEVVGFTIFDFSVSFPPPGTPITLTLPAFTLGSAVVEQEPSVLELVPA